MVIGSLDRDPARGRREAEEGCQLPVEFQTHRRNFGDPRCLQIASSVERR
jgi:hypothetical protein